MPQYLFYLGGIRIPLYAAAYLGTDTEEGEWKYFELQPYKKILLLGIVGAVGGLIYRKKIFMEWSFRNITVATP